MFESKYRQDCRCAGIGLFRVGYDERPDILAAAATLDSTPKNALELLPATNSKAYRFTQRRRANQDSIFLRLAVKGKPPPAVAR